MRIIDRTPATPNEANFRVKTQDNQYMFTESKPTFNELLGWVSYERDIHIDENVPDYDKIDWKDSLVGLIPLKYCDERYLRKP